MLAPAQPFFYALDIAPLQLVSLVFGASQQPAIDTIVFADEAGGDQDRQLALPFLPGMDAVVVEDASLRFQVAEVPQEITQYSVSAGPSGQGCVLRLPSPARLLKVDLTFTLPTLAAGQVARVIVRPATDSAFGPPILSAPDFDPPGPTYGRTLSGMSVAYPGGNRAVATLPKLLGSAWLFQVAVGDDPSKLAPSAVAITVGRVVLAAAPRNLSVILKGPSDTPLWSNPNLLLPDAGEQTVSFVPLAQRALSSALTSSSASALTLPLTLRFHSDTGATLNVTSRALSGHYTVAPLAADPTTLRLGGRSAPLVLRSPAALAPRDSTATVTARLLGRALNAGSPPAPLVLPGHGLTVSTERLIAAPIRVAARGSAAAPVTLAAIALRLAATTAAELSVELRADAAGRPGAILAPPIVRQLAAGFAEWLDLVLPTPLAVAAGSTIWAALRMTKGSVLWHAGGSAAAGDALASIDKGASWGEASHTLQEPAPPLVQAFHVLDPPYPPPVVALQSGASILLADWFAGSVATGPKEYRRTAAPLPANVLGLLRSAVASSDDVRAATTLLLYSDQVADFVVSGMSIAYDPNTARSP